MPGHTQRNLPRQTYAPTGNKRTSRRANGRGIALIESRGHDQGIPKFLRQVKSLPQEIITYVFDTNVLMNSWDALFRFHEHDVCLTSQVMKELDAHKTGFSSEALNVRRAVREIGKLLKHKTTNEITEGIKIVSPEDYDGTINCTGRLIFHFSKPIIPTDLDVDLDVDEPDDRIILACLSLKKEGRHVVLISNDAICRIKANAVGLEAEEFLGEAARGLVEEDALRSGFHEMSDDFWDSFDSNPEFDINLDEKGVYTLKHAAMKNVCVNEFLRMPDNEHLQIIQKIDSNTVRARPLSQENKLREYDVHSLNEEQKFAFQLLMDTSLLAISISGEAGCGKTFVTLGAGLYLTYIMNVYERIIFMMPLVGQYGKVGFLPGDVKDKINPILGAMHDNCRQLEKKLFTDKQLKEMKAGEKDLVDVDILDLMKGRSLSNTLVIVDEAQEMTVKELKMIMTRIGMGSKIVFLGDTRQILNPHLTEITSGLSVFNRFFADSEITGSVTLQIGERGPVANLGNLLP